MGRSRFSPSFVGVTTFFLQAHGFFVSPQHPFTPDPSVLCIAVSRLASRARFRHGRLQTFPPAAAGSSEVGGGSWSR